MLSILIPTYYYNVYPLVKELNKQALECYVNFEIIVYDDGSNSTENIVNSKINELQNCLFKELPSNIGRSAIRNLLGKDAQYDDLLFVDAGTFPEKRNFIKNYISIKPQNVISGGMTFLEKAPQKPYKLRWLYTKKREHWSSESYNENPVLCSSNFLINKSVFTLYPFDESLKNYGYEDVLFFDTLRKNNVSISCINNAVIHNADDAADTYIKKTEHAIENLIYLIEEEKLENKSSRLSRHYVKLKKTGIARSVVNIFKIFRSVLKRNFNSSYPSILLFDFYRLGYYCLIKNKK